MRVGLLVCDHVSPQFVAIDGDYPDMFRRLFRDLPDLDLVPYDLTAGEMPQGPEECRAWMTTGSRHSVYDDIPWIRSLAGFVGDVVEAGVPYVGICFGHQMLAQALGGQVERAASGWGVGCQVVEVVDPPAWLPVRSYRVLASHADQITRLPPGASVRGGNDHCPVSLMTMGDRLLGIQGHPEFSVSYAEALLRARRGATIPEEVAAAGLESLGQEPDTELLAEGIWEFLTSR